MGFVEQGWLSLMRFRCCGFSRIGVVSFVVVGFIEQGWASFRGFVFVGFLEQG